MSTEQNYIEAMNQLKEMNDTRDIELTTLKNELLVFKKQVIICYGNLVNLDNLAADRDIDYDLAILLDVFRYNVTKFVEMFIFNIPIVD